MFYLFLSAVMGVGWAISYKLALRRGCRHALEIVPVTFLTACTCMIVWTSLTSGLAMNATVVIIGALAGASLFTAVVTFFYLIKSGARLGVSWTVMVLSAVIPTCASIFVWKEYPNFWQTVALLLAASGILLLGQVKPGRMDLTRKEVYLLVTSFLTSGLAGLAIKAVASMGLGQFNGLYVCTLYAVAGVLAAVGSVVTGHYPTRKHMGLGLAMGAAGAGNVFLLALALNELSGTVAFPVRTCLTILLTVTVSYALWRERIESRREAIGLVLALLAIVLMSL